MRWAWSNRIAFLSLCLILGALSSTVAAPLWRSALVNFHQEEYGRLTYLCDSAMREHYIARARVSETPNEDSVDVLAATEIALIDCQDYDLLQKRLMNLGLRENELSLMRLRAIEREGRLDEVVRFHEIRD